ncbi:MAG TPA: DUF58 domain-containing protein [Planctomycetaceae bacterium]|nr:DUF58 domain-containing protein [Planctomycetaceae bacterium]
MSVNSANRNGVPVFGAMSLLVGIFLLALYAKGYAPSRPALKILQFVLGSTLLVGGLKSLLFDTRVGTRKPRWVRWVPYRVSLTREGAMYLVIMIAVFVGALIGRSNLLLLVFGLLAGPFVINGYVTFTMLRNNAVSRNCLARVIAGESLWVELTLGNRRHWLSSWMLILEDRLSNGVEELSPRVLFSRVPPRSERIATYRARLVHRGQYTLGPLQLSSRFPLGLVERTLLIESPGEIIEHPRLGQLTPLWRREQSNAFELFQQIRSNAGAFDDEFHRIREYRAGDNPKAIHWRTSARRNELMVREFHQTRDTHLSIVLDLWQGNPRDRRQSERVELAISFVASVCVDHCRRSRESEISLLVVGKKKAHWSGPAGPVSINPLLDPLALAEAAAHADIGEFPEEGLSNPSAVRRMLVTTRDLRESGAIEAFQAGCRAQGAAFRVFEADAAALARFCQWDDTAEDDESGLVPHMATRNGET